VHREEKDDALAGMEIAEGLKVGVECLRCGGEAGRDEFVEVEFGG
jgi:hypothetical protein